MTTVSWKQPSKKLRHSRNLSSIDPEILPEGIDIGHLGPILFVGKLGLVKG